MEVKLVTGTLGSGKTKYIFDRLSELQLLYKDSIIFLKHQDRTLDGAFIKSRAYSKKIPCDMVANLDYLNDCKYNCVVIDEYQYFAIDDLKKFLLLNKDKKIEVILTGLKYFANGDVWESYSTILDVCKEHNISCIEVFPYEATCCYDGCRAPAVKHSLKFGVVPDFGKLDIADFNLCCEQHFTKPQSTIVDYKKNFTGILVKRNIVAETLERIKPNKQEELQLNELIDK